MSDQAEIVPSAPASALVLPPPATTRAAILRAALESEDETRTLIKLYVEKHMVRDVDYGVIPGTPKPTLLKPGAEKLIELFRAEPSYAVEHRVEDWDRPLFHYEVRCELKDRETATVYAVGLGSCNSMEGRYRWRKAERTCPKCGAAAIIKIKFGDCAWMCFGKKGGCGAKFKDANDPAIIDQPTGRVENDDIHTQVNTILKMAKKRAQVDAAIALARCSDLFTQDVEDMGHGGGDHEPRDERSDDGAQRSLEDRARQAVHGAKQQRKSDRPPPGDEADPNDFEITFGKNAGTLLRDLADNQLRWYAEDCKNDRVRKMAAAVLHARKATAETKQRQAEREAAADTNETWGMEGAEAQAEAEHAQHDQ